MAQQCELSQFLFGNIMLVSNYHCCVEAVNRLNHLHYRI